MFMGSKAEELNLNVDGVGRRVMMKLQHHYNATGKVNRDAKHVTVMNVPNSTSPVRLSRRVDRCLSHIIKGATLLWAHPILPRLASGLPFHSKDSKISSIQGPSELRDWHK